MRFDSAASPTPDSAIEASALGKAGRRLLPILVLGLFVSYVDRANLGVLYRPMARELGLSATAFGLAAGLFFIGYLLFEIPSNMAMVRFGARLWIARIMASWGLVTIALAFAGNQTSLYVLRILLGVAEAGFFPGILLYLACWYPPRALGRAYSLIEVGIPVSLALASALTASLLSMDGLLGLSGWRWVFVVQGAPALLLSVWIYFALPDRPRDAKWLTPDERDCLERQVTVRGGHAEGQLRHLGEVVRSGAAWLFTLIYFCMVIGFWSVTYFLPQIVQERFHVGTVASGFISAIPWGFAAVAIVAINRSSERTGDRKWHMLLCLCAAGAGLLLSAAINSPVLALVGVSFGAAGMQASVPLFWTMPPAAFPAGGAAVGIAMINSLGNVSGLAGPWALGFFQDLTGNSRTGLYCMAGFFFVAALLAFKAAWSNAPRRAGPSETVPDYAG